MAALDSTSSFSVASATESSSSYDVFINFRGEDLHKNFIGFLYDFMKERGINAFIDSKNLWTGEAIGSALYKAIRGSKISIPVFSKGYADSKWCLQELAEIVQCHRSNNQIILPIFFFVDPSDVRNQTGTFEKAFQGHEKTFEHQTVERWREALRVVGNLKGEVLDDTKDQAEVVELVVKRALRDLVVDSTCLYEGEYRIDMDSRVKELSSLLNIGSNDVQFVGICGSGGIGKTTLAKAVYNEILLTFDKHCFLSDIRERATQFGGRVSLQKQFLKDIFKEDFEVKDLHRGKGLIKENISKKKVFLVLDDVDNKEQIDDLAGNPNWFGKGSRVIITTRDEHVLKLAKVNEEKIYRPQLLNHVDSLQLFSWHAFKNSQPPEEYMRLSHDVAHYSEGLPLILEVFGSYMSELGDTYEWECALKMLKEISPKEVQKRLRISYDNLENDHQRDIFLDAACFFIGWEKETIMSIWESCGFHPRPAISRLIKRSLLKFDGEYLIMHDHIRDMGREIVLEKSRIDPSKRSRLWSYGDIMEVLSRHKETDTIEGMSLHDASQQPFDLTTESLEVMPNLRFLNISSGLESEWQNRFELPSLYHRRLVYLKLSNIGFNSLWNVKPPDEHKLFQKLKVLDHSACLLLSRSLNFSWFPSLEQLNFEECLSLDELDESIGQLNQLKSLILKFCTSLKKLPNSIGNLTTLEKLDLSHCGKLKELPDSISGMASLKELILQSCFLLKKLPDGVGLLEKLELLDIRGCFTVVKLPRSFGGTRCLDRIQVAGNCITEFYDDFSMPPNLEELEIIYLPRLNSLPANLSALKTLKQLEIWRCAVLEYIPALPSCLVELFIEDCGSLVLLPDLSNLKMLTTLKLRDCQKLEEIPGLEEIKSLCQFDAKGSVNLAFTQKKTQESLSPDNVSLAMSRGSLSLVLKISDDDWFSLETRIDVKASIQKKDKKVSCWHSLTGKNLEYSSIDGDGLYICHFRGFDWFGVPLHENDKIEILGVYADGYGVKFCKVLLKNGELGTQTPSQNWNTLMVPDLFINWPDDGGVITLNDDGSNHQMLQYPSLVQETVIIYPSENTRAVVEEEEEMNNVPTVDFLSRLRLDSVSDAVAEGDMLRPGNDNDDDDDEPPGCFIFGCCNFSCLTL